MPAITLSPATPTVTLTGLTSAYGTVSAVTPENTPIEAAIFAPASANFNLTNIGTILSPGTSPYDAGIVLAAAGEVRNTGTINAPAGIFILGAAAGAYIANTGTIHATAGDGIYDKSHGGIYNAGQITAAGTAIALAGGGTVIDKGGISGAAAGIVFADGFSNTLILETGATVTGMIELYGTLALAGDGFGIFSLSQLLDASTIAIAAGSNWSLYGSVSGAPDIFNRGTVTAPISGLGSPGETVGDGIAGGGAVYNYGAILGGTGIATAGHYVYNSGKIRGENGGEFSTKSTGIALLAPGYIINTGTITADTGVTLAAAYSSLFNYGQISGGVRSSATVSVVSLYGGYETIIGGAVIDNFTGATIKGGIRLAAGTITNDGLIKGAVHFGPSNYNLLALGPTATLTAAADLGGGGIKLLAGPKTGTLTAANYKDAAFLSIAPSAIWYIAGSLAMTAGNRYAYITNNGTIDEKSAKSLTIASGIAGTGSIELPHTLTLNGEVFAGQKLAFTGTAETLNLLNPYNQGEFENFAPGDTIDLTGLSFASITATHFARGVLTLSEGRDAFTLTFASPKPFHHDTFALFADGPGTGITLAPPTPAWHHNLITLHP